MILLISALTIFVSQAEAILNAQPILQEVGSLPQGRWMVSMVYFESDIASQYKNQGEKGSIAQEFNRDLSWNDLAKDDPKREDQLRGLLDSKGVNHSSSAGRIVGDFRGVVQGKVPLIGYGIMDRLNLFVAIPMIEFKAESDLTYQSSPSALKFVQSLKDSGMNAASQDFAQSLNQSADDKLRDAGYDYRRSVRRSGMGDTRIEIPWTPISRVKNLDYQFAPVIIAPTGTAADVSDIYGYSTGENRWWWGTKASASYKTAYKWKTYSSVSLLYPESITRAYRIPTESGDQLSSDIDTNVRVSGGLQAHWNISQSYQVSRSWNIGLGFERQFQQSLKLSGSQWASERYSWVPMRASRTLDAITVQLRFNSIDAFLAKEFLIPTQVALGAGIPVSGKNSSSNSVIALQGAVFF